MSKYEIGLRFVLFLISLGALLLFLVIYAPLAQ
jgi:hypothetical protein